MPSVAKQKMGGLFRHRNFRHFWLADAISQVGTRVSGTAISLLVVITLHASTFEVSVLRTLQTLAYLLIGLQAGAWCDRVRNRPVLVGADLGRAVALGSIPVAAVFGALTIWQVYAAVFVAGVLTVFFDVAHQSFLPRLVPKADLIEGNAKLKFSTSAAALVGPGLGGLLVQWLAAPVAVLVDAVSYLWSAAWLSTVRVREVVAPEHREATLRAQIREGLRLVLRHPVLRAIALNNMVSALFSSAYLAISTLFLVRVIGLSAGAVGLLGSLGLVGALLGSVLARRLSSKVGAARLLVTVAVVEGLAYLLVPLTGPGWQLAWYVVAGLFTSTCVIIVIVLQVSFQQTLCPDHLLGRMNATMNFLYWGAAPVGSLLAGVLATGIGLRPMLWVAGAGMLLAAVPLLASPLRRMVDLPAGEDQPVSR
ncbi:MFS transporter [Amycolatopsis sp. NPDC051373]|uniref:MFS transporter n=1 Tax=Amycolatopsis sp. NPDC051373 TaxID=3155801 RepID=UPI00344E1A9F